MTSERQKKREFSLTFRGVRGTTPCCGPQYEKYGGNTSCLEIRCAGNLLIFDGGTGIRSLGNELIERGPVEATVFLTHTHLDHIGGLPFFKPFYCPDSKFTFFSGRQTWDCTTKAALDHLMVAPLLPIDVDVFKANVTFCDFVAGADLHPCEGVVVKTFDLNHPNGATGYRLEHAGKSICYVTDTTHVPGKPDQTILHHIQDADYFIYDASYTDEEFEKYRDFGHSTWEEGVRLANLANVKTYIPFHHDPDHNDDKMDEIAEALEQERSGSIVAREGMKLAL